MKQKVETISFGPFANPDGSPGETTKLFASDNPKYYFAWVRLSRRTSFPMEMLKIDHCMFADDFNALVADTPQNTRTVQVKKLRTTTKSWTPHRWESFPGIKFFILTDRPISRPSTSLLKRKK